MAAPTSRTRCVNCCCSCFRFCFSIFSAQLFILAIGFIKNEKRQAVPYTYRSCIFSEPKKQCMFKPGTNKRPVLFSFRFIRARFSISILLGTRPLALLLSWEKKIRKIWKKKKTFLFFRKVRNIWTKSSSIRTP